MGTPIQRGRVPLQRDGGCCAASRSARIPFSRGRSEMTKRRVHAEPRRYWTPAEESMVRTQYPHMKTAIIAAMLERTTSTVYQRAQKLGLGKSEEFFAAPASGRTCGRQGIGTRFVKGQAPANKGVKRG